MNPARANGAIVEEITIQAPAERIFQALTDPAELVRWWKAEGRFETTHVESDLRAGGKWLMRGTGPGGRPFLVSGEYVEIERPRLLVFTWLPDWLENATASVVRWDLAESGGRTTVRLTHSGLDSEAARNSHRGWPQILACLRAHAEAGR